MHLRYAFPINWNCRIKDPEVWCAQKKCQSIIRATLQCLKIYTWLSHLGSLSTGIAASATLGSGELYIREPKQKRWSVTQKPGHQACVLIRQCAPQLTPFTLFPSERHKWGYACSGQHVHSSCSESPTGYLQVHLNNKAVRQKHPTRPKENFFISEVVAADCSRQSRSENRLERAQRRGRYILWRFAHISPWTFSTCLEPACWWRSSKHWVMTTTERPCFLKRASHSAIARCAVLDFLLKVSSRL